MRPMLEPCSQSTVPKVSKYEGNVAKTKTFMFVITYTAICALEERLQ